LPLGQRGLCVVAIVSRVQNEKFKMKSDESRRCDSDFCILNSAF
jgi:hypothetical protein